MRRRKKALELFERFVRVLHEADKDEPECDAGESVPDPDSDPETDPDDDAAPNRVRPDGTSCRSWRGGLGSRSQPSPAPVASTSASGLMRQSVTVTTWE
jgi:hypothetical protein